METLEDVVIVGAGIAGLATAVALKRCGVRALVLERSEGLRATGAALTLFPNAWLALDALGLAHKLTSIYSPNLRGSLTNIADGTIRQVVFHGTCDGSSIGQGPRSVHRKALLEALAQELPVDAVRFSSKLTSIENQQEGADASNIISVHLEDGTTIKSKVLIGCDGMHSVVARWLGLAEPVHSGRLAVRGLAVFPQGHGFNQEVRQFVDVGKKAGLSPINERELYWFLSYKSPPQEENMIENAELIQREVLEKYARNFPPVYLDVVQRADLSTLTRAPLMFRYPWSIIFGNLSKGNVTVAGDAMHPMTPDIAQGGGAALEDAVVLGRHIGNAISKSGGRVPGDITQAINDYGKERRWRAAWLITASYLSGCVQQGGDKWWVKFFRDAIFYKYLYARIAKIMYYDCGKLPVASHRELDHSSKKD